MFRWNFYLLLFCLLGLLPLLTKNLIIYKIVKNIIKLFYTEIFKMKKPNMKIKLVIWIPIYFIHLRILVLN